MFPESIINKKPHAHDLTEWPGFCCTNPHQTLQPSGLVCQINLDRGRGFLTCSSQQKPRQSQRHIKRKNPQRSQMVPAENHLLQVCLSSDTTVGPALLHWRHWHVFPSHCLTLPLKTVFETMTAALPIFHRFLDSWRCLSFPWKIYFAIGIYSDWISCHISSAERRREESSQQWHFLLCWNSSSTSKGKKWVFLTGIQNT